MPIEKGFILLARAIDESEIMIKPPHFREVWLYLLRSANHTDRVIYGKRLKKGQLLTSYKKIINSLRWYVGDREESYKKYEIQAAIKYLKRTTMITTTKTTRGIIVSICNYDYYQNISNYQNHNENRNEIQTKTTPKPQGIQELKNERSVYRENTHNFSLNKIQEMFKKIASKQGRRLPVGVAEDFFNHYSANGWKRSTGARIENIEALIKQWITSKKPAAAAKN